GMEVIEGTERQMGRGEAELESSSQRLSVSATARVKWTLTQEAFDKLLHALDGDRERAGNIYQETRSNLIRFFEWRGCPFPEDHRDLIIGYYQGEKSNKIKNRQILAERLRIPIGTLRMRALRLREQLEVCVENCLNP